MRYITKNTMIVTRLFDHRDFQVTSFFTFFYTFQYCSFLAQPFSKTDVLLQWKGLLLTFSEILSSPLFQVFKRPPGMLFFLMSVTYLVDVPFRTSHISHLNASGGFLNVQTEQSQKPSVSATLARFDLKEIRF